MEENFTNGSESAERVEKVEKWKDIEGYEGRYMASNMGRIKSVFSYCIYERKGFVKKNDKEKILSPAPNTRGYPSVMLCINGKSKSVTVHKVVATAFLTKPEIPGYITVNHKDGNKLNNNIGNLEWCSHRDNMLHAYSTGLKVPCRKIKAA